MSQSHRSPRTARPCATFVARAVANAGSAVVLAATISLVTACNDSTAPIAPRPIAGASAGLIRVAAKGLATAAGTARDPMTLEQAVAVAPAGATIELSAGTYVTGGLVVTKPVTIRPASGAKVILRGSTIVGAGMWQPMGSMWRTPWSAAGARRRRRTRRWRESLRRVRGRHDGAADDARGRRRGQDRTQPPRGIARRRQGICRPPAHGIRRWPRPPARHEPR